MESSLADVNFSKYNGEDEETGELGNFRIPAPAAGGSNLQTRIF